MASLQPIKFDTTNRWDGGISDLSKNAPDIEYGFGRSVNYRTDPYALTILPKTTKESGSVITDLVKDGDRIDTDVYLYGDTGNIYKRTSAGSHSLLTTVSNSHGNGMKYYGEDDYLYYTSDKVIGRYGQVINGTPSFVNDFLGAEGGVPQNTHALDLEAASSQYASRADTASLSITGDLAIEAWIKPESLPAVGSSMVIFSKWDENTNLRSYKFEIYAVSGYFGDGTSGALTISSNDTEAPIDSAATATSGAFSISATNASFAAGQEILLHQTRGAGAGTYQRNTIVSYVAGTITVANAINANYVSGAQVRVLPQYTNVTIDAGSTYSAKAWDGTVGGILAFLANGTVTVASTASISATGKGFRKGAGGVNNNNGLQGEGYGAAGGTNSTAANYSGGGGGEGDTSFGGGGGGGGGHASTGTSGVSGGSSGTPGTGGATSGTTDLTTMTFGGGGGGGGGWQNSPSSSGGDGGNGGGIIFITGATVTVTGSLVCNGSAGSDGTVDRDAGGGGGGAGGSILLKGQTITLGATITATGGAGGLELGSSAGNGGAGSTGRIHADYLTSISGTTDPTINSTQDNTLVTTTTYQLRLGLSSTGTNEEFLTKNSTITTGAQFHVGVSWDASDSQAEFFQDGISLGTSTGALTAIHNNASVAGLGADFNSTARNFYDGLIDEVRLWNIERTTSQMNSNKETYIATTTVGLAAWYKLNNAYTDATANANDLTAANTPVFTTEVPFSAATTRNDLDQSLDTSGNTYTLATAINEGATHRQTFIPQKDPQKSIEVLVAAIGTGSWTVTVHDSLNRVIATATITNANMRTGDVEFTFSSVWRPVRGATYHFHVTSTVADGTVTTTTVSDLETVDYHTYYQFLVEDTEYHPIEQMLNLLAIGNERYLATYDAAAGYDPHRLVLPSGWRIRCFAKWRGYLMIGCTRKNAITQTDEGMIFVWDGISRTYNDFIVISEGGINSMFTYKGKLYIFAGYHGELVVYEGGDSTNDDLKKRVPKMENDEYIEIMPKAMAVWDGLLRFGVAGTSDASNVERGVYTYGRKIAKSPTSLSYDFPISTGTRASTGVKIGFVMPIAGELLIGWKDNVSYGVDVVDPTGNTFATADVEKDIKDYGRVSKKKQANVVRAEFDPLVEGQTMRVKYKLDRASSWTLGTVVSTADATEARLNIDLGEHRELQIACEMATTIGTSPKLLELGVEEDLKPSEMAY